MKTIKLFLLFLLMPFISFSQGTCTNGEIEVYLTISQINSSGAGTNSISISHITGQEYFAVNFEGSPSYNYYICLDDYSFGAYTWIIESYDENNPFNGSVKIRLNGPNGEIIEESISNGQTDGSFILEPLIPGCTDNSADNYNEDANEDDGSCIISGCTDVNAFNYSPSANTDDGSCIATVNGCTDETAFNYNSLANTDGSCEAIILGCFDSNACNYNSQANTEDDSCLFPTGCESCSGAQDGSGFIIVNDQDNDGVCDANE